MEYFIIGAIVFILTYKILSKRADAHLNYRLRLHLSSASYFATLPLSMLNIKPVPFWVAIFASNKKLNKYIKVLEISLGIETAEFILLSEGLPKIEEVK